MHEAHGNSQRNAGLSQAHLRLLSVFVQRVLESLEPSLGAGYMSSTKSFDMTHVRTKTESKPSLMWKKHHVLAVRGRGQKVLRNPLDYNPIILPLPCWTSTVS